jgi:hypothetical protein
MEQQHQPSQQQPEEDRPAVTAPPTTAVARAKTGVCGTKADPPRGTAARDRWQFWHLYPLASFQETAWSWPGICSTI